MSVSEPLAQRYRPHGSPAVGFDGENVIAAQAVIRDEDRRSHQKIPSAIRGARDSTSSDTVSVS
ncbi:DUF1737 domain-containing protein [Nocardia asiatica]|uniref:DUF1737 domain-containing protein n=1 Tax=Nocardia asiatica TaxID=209252 RepID=UPI003EE210A2